MHAPWGRSLDYRSALRFQVLIIYFYFCYIELWIIPLPDAAQVVYKERPKIEQMVRSNMPLLKSFKEFEYGFKIRDKENPKSWCAAAPSGKLGATLRPSSPCAR